MCGCRTNLRRSSWKVFAETRHGDSEPLQPEIISSVARADWATSVVQ